MGNRSLLIAVMATLMTVTATSQDPPPHCRSKLIRQPSWSSVPDGRRVILVHGFGSRASSLSQMAHELSRGGHAVAIFQYDSHCGVRGAAAALAAHLQDINQQFPSDQISLVTHSMGGLVARWCLENPENATSGGVIENVDRLVMVAPPNAGSSLASLSAASLIERASGGEPIADEDRRPIEQLDQTLSQWLGVGVGDLRPDSLVLQQLANPRRPDHVQYSILAGDAGPMPAETAGFGIALKMMVMLRDSGSRPPVADRNAGGQPNTPRPPVDRILSAAEGWMDLAGQPEWVAGQGDGVVSVASTRLTGVDDHVVLPMRHNTMTGGKTAAGMVQLRQAIADRLAADVVVPAKR